MPVLIGVISDTHGLIRPEALTALAGVARILHAGDVGKPEVLKELERIAPVTAVRGNVDTAPWARGLLLETTVEQEGRRILVVHDMADAPADAASHRYSAVITGHSHKARIDWRDGVLWLNPGSAGPKRFRQPVTLARIRVTAAGMEPELVHLL